MLLHFTLWMPIPSQCNTLHCILQVPASAFISPHLKVGCCTVAIVYMLDTWFTSLDTVTQCVDKMLQNHNPREMPRAIIFVQFLG